MGGLLALGCSASLRHGDVSKRTTCLMLPTSAAEFAGPHFHVLWSRGADELARLFPGIHDGPDRRGRGGLR